MKKLKILCSILLFMPSLLFSIDYKTLDVGFELNTFIDMTQYQNKVALLGLINDSTGRVYVYEDNNWTKLNDTVYYQGAQSVLRTRSGNNIIFDSLGNVWVCGKSLYQYVGDKWVEHRIEDKDTPYRKIREITADKFNNIWVTTEVFSASEKIDYAEIYKYDGVSFLLALKTETSVSFISAANQGAWGSTIKSLPDGRIITHRKFQKYEIEKTGIEDIYIIDQDFSIQKFKLKTANKEAFYDSVNKRVIEIIPETNNKYWFLLAHYNQMSNPPISCCSGLTLQQGSNMIPFNETNGLKIIADLYEPILKLLKLKDEYLLLGLQNVYKMKEDNILKEISYASIMENMDAIVPGKYFLTKESMDIFDYQLNLLLEKKSSMSFMAIEFMPNRDVWLLGTKRLFILKADKILDTDDLSKKELFPFPNPAFNQLHLSLPEGVLVEHYEVFSAVGEKVAEGKELNAGTLDVSALPAGVYYIRYKTNEGLLNQRFVVRR